MIVSVGDGERVSRVLRELAPMLASPLVTLERVRLCKRDGERLGDPDRPPQADQSGLGIWQKLTVHTGEHQPHGERFWSVQRHVPVLTIVIDTPQNIRRWYAIVDELTGETGLVTEIVPAMRATGQNIRLGGLALANRAE